MKNSIAKDLRSEKYKPRIVKPKKGKGSYSRKGVLKGPLSDSFVPPSLDSRGQ